MKLQHILNITLWMAAPLVAAVEIPDAPARLERSHIPQSDWNSFHALLAACRDGDTEQVRTLLAKGADKDMALFCACASARNCKDLIKELLAAGADVNAAPVECCTPLYAAIGSKRLGECEGWAAHAAYVTHYEGQAEVVSMLLAAGANPNTCSSFGRIPPIIEAARTGDAATVELLLNAGADMNGREKSGNCALHWAVAQHHNHIVELLLNRGAHPAIPSLEHDYIDMAGVYDNMPGTTPLHCAARFGNIRAAELLLQHGADINAQDAMQVTPLVCSAEAASTEVLKLLHQRGAAITSPKIASRLNLRSKSAADYLRYLVEHHYSFADSDIFSRACFLHREDILQILKDAGQKVPPVSKGGLSALSSLLVHAPADATQEEVLARLQLLIDCGADVPTMGYLPLSFCVDYGYDRVFFRLVELGAPLTSPQPEQKRLLTAHSTQPRSAEGRQRIMQWLEANHPDLLAAEKAEFERREAESARRRKGEALLQAVRSGKLDEVKTALQNGADIHYFSESGETALSLACFSTQNRSLVKFLLEQGANPDFTPGNKGWLPLVRGTDVELLRLLVSSGANINCRSPQGSYCLHTMARRNSALTACALELGADPTLTDAKGCTALMMVTTIDPTILLHQAAPQMLHHRDNDGNTALHCIAAKAQYTDKPDAEDISHYPTVGAKARLCTNIGATLDKEAIAHYLMKAGLSADEPNNAGQTPLMIAAGRGDARLVSVMLQCGARAAVVDATGKSALSYAQMSGNQVLADMLRTHGAPAGKEEALLQAAAAGNTQEVLRLISDGLKVDSSGKHRIGHEAAVLAALNSHEETLQALLQQGVLIDSTGADGRRMLNKAVEHNNADAVRLLVRLGAGLNTSSHLKCGFGLNCNYGTALDEAAGRGNLAMVELLHTLGARVDASHHRATMAFAVQGNSPDIVKKVAEYGGNIDIRIGAGSQTPLNMAIQSGKHELVRLLLQLGASANGLEQVSTGEPLRIASCNNDTAMVSMLLQGGANADHTDRYGQNLLHSVVCVSSADIVDLFIRNGADVNRQCQVSGRLTTPLINAVRYRKAESPEIIRLLLAAGARADVRDAAGKTALDYAREKGHTATVQLLETTD